MADQETEITLGPGKLLGLFLMLAAVCGIFFAVGYSLGKTSAREQALSTPTAQSQAANPDNPAGKPSVSPVSADAAPGTDAEATPTKASEPDLTFYNAVKQNGDDDDSATTKHELKSARPKEGADTNAGSAEKQKIANAVSPSGLTHGPAGPSQALPAATSSGAYVVQIAAVTHEEDAAALAGALRKKSYSAAVVNSPGGKDKLFHVVLGPYATLQDAEAMKLKLQGEGYSPIVKR